MLLLNLHNGSYVYASKDGDPNVNGITYNTTELPVVYCKECTGPKVIKLFPCSTQLSEFILLINVKMPTIVGIVTSISMINTKSERLKARNFVI